MSTKNLVIIFCFITTVCFAQEKQAYQLYNNKGKKVKYKKMLKSLTTSDMIFFGEYHDNPIAHWLQLELAKDLLLSKPNKLIIGAEMFENGNQLVLNEYLSGYYDEKKMLPEITQLWANYKTDYKPLLNWAKEHKVPFIATNIPRRYASMFYKKGFETLNLINDEAKQMIGPHLKDWFDPTVKCYADMAKSMGGHVPPNMYNMQMAQASKDATMAHFTLKHYKSEQIFYHINGSYHSNYKEGIIWWILKENPNLNIKNIATLKSSEWTELPDEQRKQIADFILVVDDHMTSTR